MNGAAGSDLGVLGTRAGCAGTPEATVGERKEGMADEDTARERGATGSLPLFAWLRAWAEEISGETRVAAACWLTRVVREEPAWLLPAMTFARTCGDESKSWVVSSNILLRATLAGARDYADPRVRGSS